MSQGCFACGASGTHVLFPLELVGCQECFLAWIREESLSVEAVETAVGTFNGTGYAAHASRFDAELMRRTRAWVDERRALVAA